MEQMGHSSIEITVDTYGHLIPAGNRSAVDRLDDAHASSRQENSLDDGLETEIGNNCKKIRLLERKLLKLWRARRDLNPQPSDPKSDALSS